MTLRVRVDLGEINAVLDGVADGAVEAARPAAQAAAQVIYDQVRINVGRIGRKSGRLASSIYQAFSKDSSPGRAVYDVSWNPAKAPHAYLVEYGHVARFRVYFNDKTGKFVTIKSQPVPNPQIVAARPYMRPAIAAFPRAEQAMRERFFSELQRLGVTR